MILTQYEQLSLIIFDVNFNLIENKYFICIRTIECKNTRLYDLEIIYGIYYNF